MVILKKKHSTGDELARDVSVPARGAHLGGGASRHHALLLRSGAARRLAARPRRHPRRARLHARRNHHTRYTSAHVNRGFPNYGSYDPHGGVMRPTTSWKRYAPRGSFACLSNDDPKFISQFWSYDPHGGVTTQNELEIKDNGEVYLVFRSVILRNLKKI